METGYSRSGKSFKMVSGSRVCMYKVQYCMYKEADLRPSYSEIKCCKKL